MPQFVGMLILHTAQNKIAAVTGSTITAVRDACRQGLLDWSPRLLLAMYACDIQASSMSRSPFKRHITHPIYQPRCLGKFMELWQKDEVG